MSAKFYWIYFKTIPRRISNFYPNPYLKMILLGSKSIPRENKFDLLPGTGLSRGGQILRIAPLFVSCGPNFIQKGLFKG